MKQIIIDHIKNLGPITTSQFINLALFHPKYGYYVSCNPFGAQGDFTTAPEISQVFGELIAAYIINNFQNFNLKQASLVEMGAGRGVMMRDMLQIFEKSTSVKSKFDFNIVEISKKLQKIQENTLKNSNSVNFHDDFNNFQQKNPKKPIFFVANELFDCFAIDQFIKTKQGFVQRLINFDAKKDQFCFVFDQFNQEISDKIAEITPNNTQVNSITEHSPYAASLMAQICQSIKNVGQMAIIIDYGYIKSPLKSTLQAIKNHQQSHIFEHIGTSDLTSLVDFNMLQNIAKKHHLNSSLITQREFLTSLGIKIRQEQLIKGKNKQQQDQIKSAISRLIDNSQMGELFKVLIVW